MNSGEITKGDKIEKITNKLWRIWWFVLFFMILPLGIAGVTSFSLNRIFLNQIEWIEELSYSVFLMLVPLLIFLLMMAYEKYRKNKFFQKMELPRYKHIVLSTILPTFPLIYMRLIDLVLDLMNKEYTIFFGENFLFGRILTPIFALIALAYYVFTRQSTTAIFKPTIKTIDRIVISFNLVIQSITTILFPQESIIPNLIINCVFFFFMLILYSILKKKTPSSTSLPPDFKIRVFFNITTVLHLVSSVLMVAWTIWIYFEIDLWLLVFQSPIIIILALKGMMIFSYRQITHLNLPNYEISQKPLNVLNLTLALSVICIDLGFFLYVYTEVLYQILPIIYILIIFIWVILDNQSKIISLFGAKLSSLTSSILFIILLVQIFPIDIIYQLTIGTIIFYVDLALLTRWKILDKDKVAVVHAFLFSIILLEVFYALGDIAIERLTPLLSNPEDVIWLRLSLFGFAFTLSSILSLFRVILKRFKGKVSRFIKWMFLILHLFMASTLVGVVYLTLGTTIVGSLAPYWVFFKILLPLIIFIPINAAMFWLYFRFGIYSKRGLINILGISINLFSIITGLSVVIFLRSLGAYLIFGLFLTIGIILHLYIRKQNQLLEELAYRKWLTFLHPLMLFEINFGVLLILIQNMNMVYSFSIYCSMLITQILLFILRKFRFVFSEKFTKFYNITSMILQAIFLPIYAYPFVYTALVENGISISSLTISYVPLFIIFVYISILLTYSIKKGVLIRKLWLKFSNISYLMMYISLSVLPSFIFHIFLGNIQFISHLFYSTIILLGCFILDVLVLHGLMIGPQKWILQAINTSHIVLEPEVITTKKIHILEKSTELKLNIGSETEIELNKAIISEFITSPSKFFGLQNRFERFISSLIWIFSILVNIISIIYSLTLPIPTQWKFTIGILAPGALSYTTLILLTKMRIISEKTKIALYNFNFLYNVFSGAIVIFPILKEVLIPLIGSVNASLIAVDCSAAFAFGAFHLLRRRFILKSPAFYYITLFILWTSFSSVFIFSVGFATNLITSITALNGTLFAALFSDLLFVTFLTLGFVFIAILGATGYIFKYNTILLSRNPVFSKFSADELQQRNITDEEIIFFKKRGFADRNTETQLKERFKILKTYVFRHVISLVTYFAAPFSLFILGIVLSANGVTIFTDSLIIESSILYLSAVLLLFALDYRVSKFVNRETSNQIRCFIWIIYQTLLAFSAAFILEPEHWYGKVLLFLQVFTMLMPPLNYFLKHSGFKVAKWMQRSEVATKILIICTSTAYLADLSIVTLSPYLGSPSTTLLGIAPYLLLVVHLTFQVTYFQKNASLRRYYRTYNRSYPYIMIALYLIRYQSAIFSFVPRLSSILTYLLPIMSVLMIWWALFYYYSMVRQFNILMNFFYQLILVFIGIIFVQSLVSYPFSFLWGFGDYFTDQILISSGLTFIIYYYARKAAYFEIYKGYTDEEPIRFRAVGIIAGVIRTIGIVLLTGTFLKILNQTYSISITQWTMGLFLPSQLSLINSVFIWALASFLGLFLFLFFLKGYFKNFAQHSYNSRFVVRIVTVLAAAVTVGMTVILYEPIYFYALPPILIGCYVWLYLIQKKYPYRANLTIGAAQSILIFLFIYWVIHKYIFAYVFREIVIEPELLFMIEVFLSAGITGFAFSRSFRNMIVKYKNTLTWLILVSAVGELSYAAYLIMDNIGVLVANPLISLDPIIVVTLTLNLTILLLFFAVAVQQWKISKKIWDTAWFLWLFLPIINFTLIYNTIDPLDTITQSFDLFGLLEIPGSILLTVIISTLLYLPVILTKFKKAYKVFFFITWIEAIPVWIWLAPNLFSSQPSVYLSPLFVIVLSLISLVPFLFSLKYWRVIAGVWIIIAITNAIFLTLLVEITFIPDILMDIFIHITTYGLFTIIFLANPVIKSTWKRYDYGILFGFILLVLGAGFVIFGFSYVLLNDFLYAISISGFITGSIMISGRYVKLIQQKINPYAIMMIAASLGFGTFTFLFNFQIFHVTTNFSSIFLNEIINLTLFPFSLAIVSSCGVVLLAQAREFIKKKHWRLAFGVFALGIGLSVGSVIDSLFETSDFLFAANVSFWGILTSYPTFRWKKPIFWGLTPLFFAFCVLYGFEILNEILKITISTISGINISLWFFSFSLFSIIIHTFVSKYYIQRYKKITSELVDIGVSDFKTLPYADEEITDDLMLQQNQMAKKLIFNYEVFPLFYVTPKKLYRMYSVFLTILLFSLSYFIAFISPIGWQFQIQIFIFGISLSAFLVLEFNKRKSIFGNPIFIRSVRFIASNLFYASILYGIILLNNYLIPLIINLLPILALSSLNLLFLNIAVDSLFFYLVFLLFSNWIRFYGKIITLLVKLSSWISFLVGVGLFIGNLFSYPIIVALVITIGSYVVVLHLKKHQQQVSDNLRLMAKSVSTALASDSGADGTTQLSEVEDLDVNETLGIDIPVPIQAPNTIHHEDLAKEADFEEVKTVLDHLLPTDGSQIPDSSEDTQPVPMEEETPQESLTHTLKHIEKQDKRSKILSSFIRSLDAWIKQGVVLELSYIIGLILSNILPNIQETSLYHLYIFRLFISGCIAAGLYNIKKVVPEKYRIVMVQVIIALLMILTIIVPFSVVQVYGIELKMVGDGISYPLGQFNYPNIIFMISITALILILELELSLWNYAKTKNENLREPFMDKWNDVLQPIMLILAAYIIANTFSLNQSLITRLLYASLVLFGETVLEKFLLKMFNRLTRARMLLYSWILISVVGIIQFVILLPILPAPITMCLLATSLILIAQFITLFLVYQLKNEKIVRNYSIDPRILNHYRYKMFSRTSSIQIRRNLMDFERLEHSDKLIEYKEFITPKYNIMASLGYVLVSLLIGALVYEIGLFQMIITLFQNLESRGILVSLTSIWNDSVGIRFILLSAIPVCISIIVMFLIFFQDQFTFGFVNAITRDIFLIFLWLLVTASAIFYGFAFIQFLEGVSFSNLIFPLMLVVVCLAQYYTIFLITDIALHTTKNMEKLEVIFPDENLETKSHSELMELLTKIEPRSLKIVKTINLIFAMIIYCTVSVTVYVLIHILTNSVVISLSLALLVLYGQAELNNYVLKAFSTKINFLYSLISWIAFSLFVSLIIPITFWNDNPIYPITQIENTTLILTNGFYLMTGFTIFILSGYITVFILKRIVSDYEIKFYWLKYLRMLMYFIFTITIFTLFIQTSWLFALFSSSIILYVEMVIERYLPIFMDKSTRLIRSIAAFSMSVISSYWMYIYLEESFDFTLAFASSLLLFTLLSQLIYNYWEHKKVAGPIYWGVISSEVGFLISSILINGVVIGIGSGLISMMLYPVIFEYQKFVEFFQNLLENLRIIVQKIKHFFKNFWVYMKNFYIKFKVPITIVMVMGISIVLTLVIQPYLKLIQAIFISSAIGSTFLFPIFITPKALKDEKTFSKMVYYAAIVYVFANVAIFSFVRINIVWGLLSLVLFSSILLVVIYRRETLYSLSVRWRFIGLILTILSALILVSILVLYFLNIITINFF